MTWFKRLWRRRELEEQLEKELRFHMEAHAADLIARGYDPDEARRQARLALEGIEQVKESCRDARGTRWLEDFVQDVRYAFRTFRLNAGFACVALLTLALGAGATTAMFTVVNGVLLKPLAYPEPERLVSLHEQTELYGGGWAFAYLNFIDCQRQSRLLSPMAAWRYHGGVVSEPGEPEYVYGRQISADLFAVLGIPLSRGRAFLPDEDRLGGAPVAIISYRLWQQRYGGKPGAIGAALVFDGKPYTIVGIAPPGFQLSGDADVYTPLGQYAAPTMQNREMHPGIRVIARLAPGATLAQARAELAAIGKRLAEEYPKSNAGHGIGADPFRQEVVGDVQPALWMLLGAVSLVLFIACANIASLLLARAVSRDRELAMRVALGAGRARLVRQCLTESTVLAIGGGALGVLFAAVTTGPFLAFWPGGLPRAGEVHLDWRVLLFALGASLLSGMLFGLAPALRAPVREVERVLRAGGRTVTAGSSLAHSTFVISEFAIALVLLTGAGMLGRSLLRALSLYPGFDPRHVLVTGVALSSDALASPDRIRAAWPEIVDRVRRIPGVEFAAIADVIPMGGDDEQIGYWTSPAPPPADQMPLALFNLVGRDYLRAMGIPLLAGRFFTDHDRVGSEPVVVIDEIMARRAFGDADPVGKTLMLQFIGPRRVIGVAGHVRHWGLGADDAAKVREQIYMPFAQLPDPFLKLTASGMLLIVRTAGPPLGVLEAVQREVRGASRDQVAFEPRTMEQIVSGTLARQRFLLLLFGIFASLALALACIGVYGVLAYLTSQRVPEFGVRMALGAAPNEIMRLVFRHSARLILAGAGLGVVASLAAGRVLARLAEVQTMEPLTIAGMIVLLAAAAMLATFFPARRASRIDPVQALRQE
jgi:predicted permease